MQRPVTTRRSASTGFPRVQPAMARAAAADAPDVRLAALAAGAGLSPFHFQRLFTAVAGETPKQYALRLRVSRGAVLLVAGTQSVLDVALACGFGSHEAFTRAFRRQFGTSPSAYRRRGLAGAAPQHIAEHAAAVSRVAPCVRLFHLPLHTPPSRTPMPYSIEKKELAPQPVLVARRRVPRSGIANAIGGALGEIFHYAQQHGLALTGHPITRYLDAGPGLLTIEPGMRLAGPAPAAGDGTVVAETLPGGPAATTIHHGPYDTLADAYAALQSWMEANGHSPGGAPWESYITDPAEHPDPKDWQTEICWPLR